MAIIEVGNELWRVGPGTKGPTQGPFIVTGHMMHCGVVLHTIKEISNYLISEKISFPTQADARAEADKE